MTIDRAQMLGIAHAERERLGRTIQYTPPAVWDAESVCAGWRNRDIVAHLAAQDTAAAQLLAGEPAAEFDAFREANDGDLWVSGFNEWAVKVRDELPTRQLITDWGKAVEAFLVLAARLSDDEWSSKKVEWVAGEIGVRYLVQSRIIEWWFHQEDIRESAGLEGNPQHDPVYLANDMAIRMLPWALGHAGLSFPGRSIQVDLEGVGGGTWHWGSRAADVATAGQETRRVHQRTGTRSPWSPDGASRRTPTWTTATWSSAVTRRSRSSCLVLSARESSCLELLRAFVESNGVHAGLTTRSGDPAGY